MAACHREGRAGELSRSGAERRRTALGYRARGIAGPAALPGFAGIQGDPQPDTIKNLTPQEEPELTQLLLDIGSEWLGRGLPEDVMAILDVLEPINNCLQSKSHRKAIGKPARLLGTRE